MKNVKSEGKIVNNWKEKGRLLRKEQCNVNLSNKCEVARAAQSFELAPKLKFPPPTIFTSPSKSDSHEIELIYEANENPISKETQSCFFDFFFFYFQTSLFSR